MITLKLTPRERKTVANALAQLSGRIKWGGGPNWADHMRIDKLLEKVNAAPNRPRARRAKS